MTKELRVQLNNKSQDNLELLKAYFEHKTNVKSIDKGLEIAVRFLNLK